MNVYDTQITIVNGVSKPTYNWGAPHCTFTLQIYGGQMGEVQSMNQTLRYI